MALPRSQSHWDWLLENGFNVRGTNNANVNGNGGWHQTMWRKMFASGDELRQRMVLAWSQLFVVSFLGLPISWRNFALTNYLDILEERALGNFRDLLEAVTLSSAMGTYLNMKNNKKADPTTGRVPDENYAREVMQLFTIGLYELNVDGTLKLDGNGKPIETYTNEDTQGLAKVFTGWKQASGSDPTGRMEPAAYQHGLPMQLDATQHSQEEKRFLGVTIAAGTDAVTSLRIALNTLFNHANTAPFIAKFLIQRFVSSNPSPAYVARVAAVFIDNGSGMRGDMAAVLKAVLLDEEAQTLSSSAIRGKLREPVVRLLQWARAFGVTSTDGLWNYPFTNGDTALGQMPMYSPSVFNFFRPGYVPPNTRLASAGHVAPEFQILTEPTVVSYINHMVTTIDNTRVVRANYDDELPIARDVAALVDRYNLLFAANQISSGNVQVIKTAVESIAINEADPNPALLRRVKAAIALVMSSPEYLIQK